MYKILYHKRALKDIQFLKAAHLDKKAKSLIALIERNPWIIPSEHEKLQGDLSGLYSRRINQKHRLVYSVDEETKTVRILSLWSHYETIWQLNPETGNIFNFCFYSSKWMLKKCCFFPTI